MKELQLIRFTYADGLPDAVPEFLEHRVEARVVETRPLEIIVDESASVPALLEAMKKLGLKVTHVFVRRGVDNIKRAV